MPSIRHLQFGGLRPAVSDKLLHAPYATVAHNAQLTDGELCPFREPLRVSDCQGELYLVPDTDELICADRCMTPFYDTVCGGAVAMAFLLPGPERLGRRLPDGSVAPLVPPAPADPPLVTQITPGTVTDENGPESRVYTYTWVNQFGYESPPAPPTPALPGAFDATYEVLMGPPPPEVVCVRLYRMTNAQDNDYGQEQVATSFQLVRELDPTTVFLDSVLQRDMELGELLTADNCGPPEMDCVLETEAGYLVGWRGREVYFSERGEPHNWPMSYRLTLQHPVVGGAVLQNAVFLGTTGTPFRIDVAPPQGEVDTMQFNVHRYKDRAPLRYPKAITCTDTGVAMSSIGGVWHLDGTPKARLATRSRVAERDWDARFDPRVLVWHQGRLYGAGGPIGGFVLGWQGGADQLDIGDLVTIDWAPDTVHSGHDGVLYYTSGGATYAWGQGPDPMTYTWRSAVTRTPGEMHWAAVKVQGAFEVGQDVTVTIANLECGEYDVETVDESTIYRVPCHPKGVHWTIELEGTACVCEVHLATSKQELTEQGASPGRAEHGNTQG